MRCIKRLEAQWGRGRFLCVDLNPDPKRIPAGTSGTPADLMNWHNQIVVEATREWAAAYRLNLLCYLALGVHGMKALLNTCNRIRNLTDAPFILDCEFSGNRTDAGHLLKLVEAGGFHAITANPYGGWQGLQPLFADLNKMVFILCHADGMGGIQDLSTNNSGEPLYRMVARMAAYDWNQYGTCGLHFSGTEPLYVERHVRMSGLGASQLPLLITGIGGDDALQQMIQQSRLPAKGRGVLLGVTDDIAYAPLDPEMPGLDYWRSGPHTTAAALHGRITDIVARAPRLA